MERCDASMWGMMMEAIMKNPPWVFHVSFVLRERERVNKTRKGSLKSMTWHAIYCIVKFSFEARYRFAPSNCLVCAAVFSYMMTEWETSVKKSKIFNFNFSFNYIIVDQIIPNDVRFWSDWRKYRAFIIIQSETIILFHSTTSLI